MSIVGESPELFEERKADHIRLALDSKMQAEGNSGFESIRLLHEALPEIDFSEVRLEHSLFSRPLSSPMFVSSMTAGHAGSVDLNLTMAKVAERRGWAMGVGSQRRQLTDPAADQEWKKIRKSCPRVRFFGNIGLAQLIVSRVDEIVRLAETLEADAMIVHANALQECMQPEGTPQFKGGLQALEKLAREIGVPVVLKETGCGFSRRTLERLNGTGIRAVDVSGYGGTHWGRIEGGRSKPGAPLANAAETFRDWGIRTVDSLIAAIDVKPDYEVWASGGIRSGLDAAKAIAMGAKMVGFAKPIIEAALKGEEELDQRMALLEYELKTALFCTGSRNVVELFEKRVWEWAARK